MNSSHFSGTIRAFLTPPSILLTTQVPPPRVGWIIVGSSSIAIANLLPEIRAFSPTFG